MPGSYSNNKYFKSAILACSKYITELLAKSVKLKKKLIKLNKF